jgi:hypothetical protein
MIKNVSHLREGPFWILSPGCGLSIIISTQPRDVERPELSPKGEIIP